MLKIFNCKDKVREIILKLKINPDSKIIEFGCSDIRPYSEYLIEYFDDYIGCDIDDNSLKKAKEKTKNIDSVKILKKRIEETEYEDEMFDVIICNNMLAYTDKRKSLNEIYRILRNNGYIISLYNNTIDWPIDHIIHYNKYNKTTWKDYIYPFVTILNTLLYRVLKIRLFTTTYSSTNEFKGYMRKLSDCRYDINTIKLGKMKFINLLVKKT